MCKIDIELLLLLNKNRTEIAIEYEPCKIAGELDFFPRIPRVKRNCVEWLCKTEIKWCRLEQNKIQWYKFEVE